MRDDLIKVLTMLSEGKLNVEKSAELIEAMYKKEDNYVEIINKTYSNRMLRVKVDSADGDKVNVNLPIAVIKAVLKATANYQLTIQI